MNINDYLYVNKIKKTDFCNRLGLSRVAFDRYMLSQAKVPYYVKLAIEYITIGEVRKEDWDDVK